MFDYQRGTSDNIPDMNKIDELRRVCKPVVEYLRENYTPYDKVLIDYASAELLSGEVGADYEDVPD